MTLDKRVEEIAMNIVHQLDDDSGASVDFRQKNNDKRIDFVAKLLTQYHQDMMGEVEKFRTDEPLYVGKTQYEFYKGDIRWVYNQAIDDIIKSLSK